MADRDAFDTATRIAAGDDGTNYDNVAISLHWATALLVIVQFVLAITWDYFSRDMRENLQSVHISLGVLLTAVILARIVWRLLPGHQRSALVSGWVKLASKAVHNLL
jgi:cytochrome b561